MYVHVQVQYLDDEWQIDMDEMWPNVGEMYNKLPSDEALCWKSTENKAEREKRIYACNKL